jgi:dihydroflavonol-4-reductase
MLASIATLLGRRPPRIRMPRSAIVPLAVAAETIARFTGREPLVTLDALRMSKYRMFFTTAKAERDLGMTARPFTEALADAIDWFHGAGYIKPRA